MLLVHVEVQVVKGGIHFTSEELDFGTLVLPSGTLSAAAVFSSVDKTSSSTTTVKNNVSLFL
jgi:hypothetical protein